MIMVVPVWFCHVKVSLINICRGSGGGGLQLNRQRIFGPPPRLYSVYNIYMYVSQTESEK